MAETYERIQDASQAQDELIQLEDRLRLVARVIGSTPSNAEFEELSDSERRALEGILLDAAEQTSELYHWTDRVEVGERDRSDSRRTKGGR